MKYYPYKTHLFLRKKMKKKKKIGEALESKDIEIIKKLIRDTIADVYRDIWIKRNSWK